MQIQEVLEGYSAYKKGKEWQRECFEFGTDGWTPQNATNLGAAYLTVSHGIF